MQGRHWCTVQTDVDIMLHCLYLLVAVCASSSVTLGVDMCEIMVLHDIKACYSV